MNASRTPFRKAALEIFESAKRDGRLISDRELIRKLAEKDKTTLAVRPWAKDVYSSWGCAAFVTKVTARSPESTWIVWDPERHMGVVNEVEEYLSDKQIVALDRQNGMAEGHTYNCRGMVTSDYARIIHMWKSLLLPVNKITKTKHGVKKHASPHNEGELLPDGVEPDTILVMVPEWCEVKGKKDPLILVDPEGATTFALGVDYVGEMKKGHLRMVMYLQKKKYRRSDGKEGGLGLHAGAKLIRIRDKRGKLVEKGLLFLGLTATGKTTHTFHHWWLDEKNGETIIIKQDDFGTLTKEGKFIGTEQGCYLKLDGLDEKSQPLLYNAVRKGGKSVSIENVYIDPQTLEPDFKRFDHPYVGKTTNSRGIIPSVLFGKYFDPDNIDVEEVDAIVFITRRNTIVPPVAKLKTPEQAAAYFMLGESVHSSGSTKDPNKIGQSIREVGTNPFIVGPEYEEGNIFLEILKEINKRRRKEGKPEVEVYLFNTGRVGAQDARDEKTGRKITIEDSVNIIKAIAKGTIEWEEDPDWCYLVPKKIEGMDYSQFDPRKYYTSEKYAELTEELRKERMEWLKKFEREGLVPEIAEEIEPMGAEKP